MAHTVHREDLDTLQDDWARLLEAVPEPVPFVHPAWQRVWLDEFLDGRELHLYAVRDGGELIGVAPLLKDGDGLTLVGHYSICDYMDFVVAPGRARDVLSALLDTLVGEDWSQIELRGLREGSPTLEELPALAESKGLTWRCEDEAVAPRITLADGWEPYLASLAKKERHELRRKTRKLQGAGDLEVNTYTTPQDVEAHLPVLLRFMVESRTDKANFLSEQMGLFFHRATQALAAHGLVRLYEMELDATPVASVLCFDQGGQFYMYNSGYDPEYAAMSAGLVSKGFCVQDAIESGRHCVDMLRGDEAYKYKLGGEDQKIYRCVISRA